MSKSSLGKSLGDLMNGDSVAGKAHVVSASASTTTTATTTTTTDGSLGRGLTTLVSAHRSEARRDKATTRKFQPLPAWFFFAADLLLLAYVVGITFDAPRPFDFGIVLFCAVSVALGCALALLGLNRLIE